jgi:mRNA deadenylase 3'-5' endonuclease subunit Ccr4
MFTCKGCLDRKMGCHGSCEKYKQERAEHDKRIAQQEAQKDTIRYQIETYNRLSPGYIRKSRRHGHR